MDLAHGGAQVAQSLSDLLALLEVEEIDRDLFRGRNPEPSGRQVLYGGHVAAQALRAAQETLPSSFTPHSLATFSAPARSTDPRSSRSTGTVTAGPLPHGASRQSRTGWSS